MMYNTTVISFEDNYLTGSASAGLFIFATKSALKCVLVLQNALDVLLYICKIIRNKKGDN